MKTLTLDATIENIAVITEFVDQQLMEQGCIESVQKEIDIVLDELLSNIAKYAYVNEIGKVTTQVEFHPLNKQVILTFIDSGIPFNPLKKEVPDITLNAEHRKIGGLGIYLVTKLMDLVEYEYKENKNILKIYKHIG